jgi:hypothetical protein
MQEVKEKEAGRDPVDAERAAFAKSERERVEKETASSRPAAPPPRKADGSLTRAGMEAVIRGGGGVLHAGTIYTKADDLPDEATLTEGDAKASAAAGAALDAQIAALAQQKAALEQTHARNVKAEADKKAEPAHPKK